MVGAAVQDYLKTIYKLSQHESRVSPSKVAERLTVSVPAVTKMVKRLQELNLCRYSRSEGLRMTAAGTKIALEMIRHHRLLELYLMEALGYGWDEVHEEAEKLEHVISEEFEAKIDELLEFPTRDPHGDPIPTRDGRVEERKTKPMEELEPGQVATVERVSDGDPTFLRYLATLGLFPGTQVRIVATEPFGGPIRIEVDGAPHDVGNELARNVFVSPGREV